MCECGDLVGEDKFRDYIKTSLNPSTPTVGHEKCGYIFNFIDTGLPKRYSSKKELKILAKEFAKKKELSDLSTQKLLLNVDRLKRGGKLTDYDILTRAVRALR